MHSLSLMPPPPSIILKHRPPPPAASTPLPLPVPEISSETSAPPSTLRVPSMYLVLNNFKTGNFLAGPHSFPCPTPPFTGSSWSKRHCSVHVPFPLTKHLGSFSSDPDNYLKEFKYLTQSYDLTWHDIYIILSFTLLPEEKEGVLLRLPMKEASYGKPLRCMLVRYTGLRTLSLEGPWLSPEISHIIRQGDWDEQPVITWLLASLWAFKRQGIKPSTLISSVK